MDSRGIIKVLSGYYIICCLIIIRATLSSGTSVPNLYLYSILCVLSSFCLGAYFYNILLSKPGKRLVLIFCAINGLYYLFANFIRDGHAVFPSMAYVLLSTSVVILCFFYIVQLLGNVKEEPLSMSFDFWFVASLLIYFIGTFVIFLTYGYLTQLAINDKSYTGSSEPLAWLWGLHNVLLFLSSLLTSAGIAWIYFHRRSPS